MGGGVRASVTLAKASRAIRGLVSIGFVKVYDVARQRYYELPNWLKHQKVDKPGKPRVPAPECKIATSSRDTRETLAPDHDLGPRPKTNDHDLAGVRACESAPRRDKSPDATRGERIRKGYLERFAKACPGIAPVPQAQAGNGGPWLDLGRLLTDEQCGPFLDAYFADDFCRQGHKMGTLLSERVRLLTSGPKVAGQPAAPIALPASGPLVAAREAYSEACERVRQTEGTMDYDDAVDAKRAAQRAMHAAEGLS